MLFSQKMKLSLKKDSTNSVKEEDSLCPSKERKRQDESLKSVTLRVKDLQKAELFLIKASQSKAFPEETEALATKSHQENGIVGRSVKRTSPIHHLKPIVDDDGVPRVGGGRLHQAELPYDVRHPVLLPKKAHLTDLVIRHFHQRAGHQGRARTHTEIRLSGYWIVNASSLIGYHISKCVTCRKLRAPPQQQVMAELPTDRFEQVPPFTFSAVDYGPFYIKEGRKEMK